MTVFSLIRRLSYLLITRQLSPGDRVVREWGDWDEDGQSTFKEVHFVNHRVLPEHPDQTPEGVEGGLNHAMFSRKGTLGARRLAELD